MNPNEAPDIIRQTLKDNTELFKSVTELQKENARLRSVVAVSRRTADHWRRAAVRYGWETTAHPLCLVLAALDGETDPEQLGLSEEEDAATEITQHDQEDR